jgi:hypothetical protein
MSAAQDARSHEKVTPVLMGVGSIRLLASRLRFLVSSYPATISPASTNVTGLPAFVVHDTSAPIKFNPAAIEQ